MLAEHAELLSEHDDPRGVPIFPSALLDMVLAADGYESALDCLGDAVTFV
jgi:hypothetical protein